MLVPSICGLCTLGSSVIETEGVFVAAVAAPTKLNPSRTIVNTLDTTYLQVHVTGRPNGALVTTLIFFMETRSNYFLRRNF